MIYLIWTAVKVSRRKVTQKIISRSIPTSKYPRLVEMREMPYRESTYHSERLKLGESRVILDGRLELHNKQKLFDIKLRSEESLDRSLHLTPAHKNVSNHISVT